MSGRPVKNYQFGATLVSNTCFVLSFGHTAPIGRVVTDTVSCYRHTRGTDFPIPLKDQAHFPRKHAPVVVRDWTLPRILGKFLQTLCVKYYNKYDDLNNMIPKVAAVTFLAD